MRVVIVGAGKLGYKLAEALLNSNNHIIVVDINSNVLERITDHLDVLTIKGNGAQLSTLKELNMELCDLIIAVTSSDETNMVICSMAKSLGCTKAIARIRNPEFSEQLSYIKSQMSIDYIINPELATSNEIIKYILKRHDLYTEDFAKGKVSMVDFHASEFPDFIGKKIMDLENMDGLLIVAISRDGNIIIPHGATEVKENDILYFIGKTGLINQLTRSSEASSGKKHVKKVMIFGGGKIGFYLAQRLSELGIGVKIIEKDLNRCNYLSENLNNALVIHGDGTDLNLLEEEDINLMDAFIGVTGYDEENLMMTLLAKQYGVKKVIAKVSRASYVAVIEKLGIDVALNPVNISASKIIKYIRGGKVVSVSLLLRGQGEVTEVIASDGMQVVGKPLSELNLPKSIIVGSIVRDGDVIIPNGKSIIYPGDRFITFSLVSEVPTLEKITSSTKGGLFNELWNRNKGIRQSTKA